MQSDEAYSLGISISKRILLCRKGRLFTKKTPGFKPGA
jgi:hypothetical protein